jgi:hypothetical protein
VFDRDISRRYQELDLYVRQSHAERDLEKLGRDVLRAGGFSGRAEDCSYAAVSKACS